MPRNVQKDPESSLAWTLGRRDARGAVSTAKFYVGGPPLSPALVPFFNAVWGVPANLRRNTYQVLPINFKVMRREMETGTRDLREASGIKERARSIKR